MHRFVPRLVLVSDSMLFSRAIRLVRAFLISGSLVLAGCSTTGNSFNTTDIRFLMPGETTLQEASQLLQGEPVNIYRAADGSATARWAHRSTVLTDAVYFTRELWLAFDPYGRYQYVVKTHNLPHLDLYQDGRRIDAPNTWTEPRSVWTPQPESPAIPVVPAGEQPVSQAGELPVVQAGEQPAASAFSHTAVSYPLGQ